MCKLHTNKSLNQHPHLAHEMPCLEWHLFHIFKQAILSEEHNNLSFYDWQSNLSSISSNFATNGLL